MVDGKIDGQFIIRQGQGITQGIAEELGLSKDECKQISGSIWNQIIQEVENQENLNVTNNNGAKPNRSNNFLVHTDAVIKFSKECWNRIVGLVNNALGKNIQVENIEDISDVTATESVQQQRIEEHKAMVEKAVALLEQNWEMSGLGEHFSTEEDMQLFLQCLKEVKYDTKGNAGHVDEKGIVHIETEDETCKSLAEMTKLLIHEANHAFINRKARNENRLVYPTKAEETECETLALTATGKLVAGKASVTDGTKTETINSFEIYNNPITYYAENNPQDVSGFQNWLDGYKQLADNLDGDITIQHHPQSSVPEGTIELADNDLIVINGQSYQISANGEVVQSSDTGRQVQLDSDCKVKVHGKLYDISVQNLSATEPKLFIEGGDVLEIEGYPAITIGSNAMLEGNNQTCIMQLLVHHADHSTPTGLGNIVFDDMQPTENEANLVNNFSRNDNSVRFTLTKADGTKLYGSCYKPNLEELNKL